MKKEKWMGAAAVFSALGASLCCVGPAVFIALGFGGLAGFSVFEKYHPLLMGVSFTVLASSFYFTYRKKEACDGGCSRDADKKRKAVLWVVAVLVVGLNASPYLLAAVSKARNASAPVLTAGTYDTLTVSIVGMTCEVCASHVQEKLSEVPGVLHARVNFEEKTAVVQCEKGSKDPTAILAAVKDAGYEASLVPHAG